MTTRGDLPSDAAASERDAAAEISVRRGNPIPAESAAVVAVVTAAVDELRSEGEVLPAPTQNAWERSRRGLRTPLGAPLGPGAWRGFTGLR